MKNEDIFKFVGLPLFIMTLSIPIFGSGAAAHALGTKNVQEFVRSKNMHFDLVIHEDVYMDSFLIFGHVFKAPVVSICKFSLKKIEKIPCLTCVCHFLVGPLGIMEIFDQDMGLITPSSHVSHTLLTYTDKMNFFQRWYNAVLTFTDWIMRHLVNIPLQNWILRQKFSDLGPLPSVYDLRQNISLIFVNAHRSITHPRPSMPGLIYIGGAHIKPPNPLPSDLQQFLDEAKHGAIYFSLGTIVKSSNMPKEKLQIFLGERFFKEKF